MTEENKAIIRRANEQILNQGKLGSRATAPPCCPVGPPTNTDMESDMSASSGHLDDHNAPPLYQHPARVQHQACVMRFATTTTRCVR